MGGHSHFCRAQWRLFLKPAIAQPCHESGPHNHTQQESFTLSTDASSVAPLTVIGFAVSVHSWSGSLQVGKDGKQGVSVCPSQTDPIAKHTVSHKTLPGMFCRRSEDYLLACPLEAYWEQKNTQQKQKTL